MRKIRQPSLEEVIHKLTQAAAILLIYILSSYIFIYFPGFTVQYIIPTHTHTQKEPRIHLSIAHERGVFSHQDVGAEEEDEGVTEARQSPVQEGPEGEQRVLADVPVGGKRTSYDSLTGVGSEIYCLINGKCGAVGCSHSATCTGRACSAARVDGPAVQTDCRPGWAVR